MDAVCSFYQNVSDWENFEICRERLFGVLEREKLTESDIYANGEEPSTKLSSLHSDKMTYYLVHAYIHCHTRID